MAQLIETAGADRVISCDLHNAAIQAYFDIHCDRLSAQNLLQAYFKEKNFDIAMQKLEHSIQVSEVLELALDSAHIELGPSVNNK